MGIAEWDAVLEALFTVCTQGNRLFFGYTDQFTRPILKVSFEGTNAGLGAFVGQRTFYLYGGGSALEIGVGKNAISGDVGILVLVEPHMSINARTLVKPTFVLGSVYPDYDDVVAVVIDEVGDVIGHADVTTGVGAEVKAIDPNLGIAEYAIKLDLKSLTGIGGGYPEMFAVPSDAGLGEMAAYGFVAMNHHIKIVFVDKRQFYSPIVGKVQAAPGAVFEAGVDGGLGCAAGFGKNGGDAVVEVFFGVGGVAEVEFPVGIEVDALAGGALGVCP